MECCKNKLKGLLPNWLVNMLSQSEGEKNITYPDAAVLRAAN